MTTSSARTIGVALPESYKRARQKLARREVSLDWTKLGRKEPRVWPGMLWLWSAADARRENAERRALLDEAIRDRVFLIGTNTAGLLFAIDSRARVVLVDECEMSGPTLLAKDFELFERSFVSRRTPQAPPKAPSLRGVGAQWRKLDAILEGRHALSRSANIEGILVDIVSDYRRAGQMNALDGALTAFVKRHPGRARLATKMRKLVREWGKGR